MSTSSRQKITVVCPFCKERVDIEKLPAHKVKYHAGEMKQPSVDKLKRIEEPKNPVAKPLDQTRASVPPDSKSPDREFTLCPYCTVRLKTSRLSKHYAKVHPNAVFPYRPGSVIEPLRYPEPPTSKSQYRKSEQDSTSKTLAQKPAIRKGKSHPIEPRKFDEHNKPVITPMDGVQVRDPGLVRKTKQYVIDESGILVNPDLLQTEEMRKSREERWKSVTPNKITSRPEDYPPKGIFQKIAGKTKKVGANNPKTPSNPDETFIRRIYETITRAERNAQYTLIACPFCWKNIEAAKFLKHLTKRHRLQPVVQKYLINESPADLKIKDVSYPRAEKEFTTCHVCKCRLKTSKLKNHLSKVHPDHRYQNISERKTKIGSRQRTINRQDNNAQKADSDGKGDNVNTLESFRQSFDEKRDGSKGLGHMRREGDGKFGSFPLHDDYSDEADAE